jgi:6-phosphogluconolactonase
MIMTHTVVYVSCAQSREIEVFSLSSDCGEIRLRQRVPTAGAPGPMKASPDRRVLYAGTRSDDAILAFAIDAGRGELALLGSAPTPGAPTYLCCDQAQGRVFCASYGGNLLAVFPLDARRAARPANQVEAGLPRAHAALIDASNQWLLVPLLGADAIRSYRLGDDGRIAPNDPALTPVRPGSGPRHPVFSADNRRLYCLNELDGSIDCFDFDPAAGTLALKQSVSMLPPGFAGKPWAAELRATPDGRFLYATDRTTSSIAAFSVEADSGRLSTIDHYPTETQPRGMAIDPSGRWLIAAGQLSSRLTVYAVDPATGRLAAVQSHATGADPIGVEMVALGGERTG